MFGDVHLVGDQQHRDAAAAIQLLKQVHHLDAGPGVEVAGRLVGQQDRRLVDQRPRDGDALLLAARQLVGIVIHALAEPDDLQDFLGPLVALGGLHLVLAAVVEQRQLDVVERRRPRQQVEALEDEADLAVAHDRELIAGHPRDILAVEDVLAARRAIKAAEDVHERRLAGAGRARDRHELALLDVHVGAAERAHRHFADRVGLDEVANGDD